MRKLAWICLGILMAFSVIVAALLALVKSESGSAWIVRQVTARVLPADLTISGIRGDLFSGITIDDVHYKVDFREILIKRIRLRTAPLSLLTGTLQISDLDIQTIDCTLPEDRNRVRQWADAVLADLPVYANFSADRIRVSNLAINAIGQRIEMRQLNLKIHLAGKRLVVEDFEGFVDTSRLGFSGEVHLVAPIAYAGRFRFRSPLIDELEVAGTVRLTGNAESLTMDVDVREPMSVATSATLKWGDKGFILAGLQAFDRNESDDTSGPGQTDEPVNHSPRVLHLDGVQARILNGKVTVDGHLTWQGQPEWDLSISSEHINPASRFPDWPGDLALSARVQGRLTNGTPRVRVPQFKLLGLLLDQPIDATGHLSTAGARLSGADIQMVSGVNTMNLVVGDNAGAELVFDFAIPDPYSLWPNFKGTFTGNGTIKNAYDNPQAKLRIEGTQINYVAASVKRIDVAADISITNPPAVNAKIEMSEMQLMKTRYPKLSVSGTGDLNHMKMSGTIQGVDSQFNFTLLGVSPDIPWELTLENASLESAAKGAWALREPASIHLDQDNMAPIEVCWEQGRTARCIEAQWRLDAGLKIEGNPEAPPFKFISQFIKSLLDSRHEKVPGVIASGHE